MNKPVTAAELKTHLSALLDRAAAGEETLITRHGKPVARLAPVVAPAAALPPRQPGALKGKLIYDNETLWAPMSEEELAGWEGAYSDKWGITLASEMPKGMKQRKLRKRA
jgi:prevent-host-death family protein